METRSKQIVEKYLKVDGRQKNKKTEQDPPAPDLQQFEEEAGPAEAEHVAGDVVPDADEVPEADELNVNSQIDELPPILTDVT
jgi:hypothetical protein